MWLILEGQKKRKSISKLPLDILKKYEKWKDIAAISGPQGLKLIKGLHDEALKGEWQGFRSSRLNIQYRVIYKVDGENIKIKVIDINAHKY